MFKPLVKVEMEGIKSIVDASFGLLKGKDTLKALRELEDEWGFC